MNLNPLNLFRGQSKVQANQAASSQASSQKSDVTNEPNEKLSLQQQEQQPVSYSRNAFADGVSATGELVTLGSGLVGGGLMGMAAGAAATAVLVAGLGVMGPAAAVIGLVGAASGAVLGAGTGASLAEKASKKFGEWGAKLAGKLGLSSKLGEAAGRGSLAVGLGAAVALGGPVAIMAVAGGLANKAVGMVIDAVRGDGRAPST